MTPLSRFHTMPVLIGHAGRATKRRNRARVPPQERNILVQQIILDAEAGQISAELTRRGIAAHARVHVVVELRDNGDLPMAAIAQTGRAFDWLAEEPDLYTDADLVEATR